MAEKLRVLDLFSGIGGFSLGLERTGGFETVAFCEIEEFPRKVLAKHWPEVFCHHDVTKLTKETLCKGYAENALINQLCKETGGNLASVKNAIETIKENAERRTQTSTTNGPQSVEKALLIIMEESARAAENPNTLFWQSITSIMTETQSAQNTKELHGRSLSSADFLTITKFFVTIATWQKPFTVPAHIKHLMKETSHDVTKLTGDILKRDGISVDVITGGFPCQDLSTAGKQAGMGEETRSGLWSEIVRLIGELRPQYVIVENVANLLSGPSGKRGGWFGRVLGDLAECGYDAEWENIPASALGASHRRERVWVVGYPREARPKQHAPLENYGKLELRNGVADAREVATNSECFGQPGQGRAVKSIHQAAQVYWKANQLVHDLRWPTQPPVRGRNDGVSFRLDQNRVAACGNAVVPQIPELIGHAILQAEAAQ